MVAAQSTPEAVPTLSADVPVVMPELPRELVITAAAQFKAIAEPTRSRILGIIQHQPATAKQIADRLGIAPGAAGHHLQVLEAAGLAQVVARRQVRGTVAKYYTRTARIFSYQISPDVTGGSSPSLDIVMAARNQLADTLAEGEAGDECSQVAFPHVRVSPERARLYAECISGLVEDLLAEPDDANGISYGVCLAMFRAPRYMQADRLATPDADSDTPRHGGTRLAHSSNKQEGGA